MIKKYERLSLVIGVPGIFIGMIGAIVAQIFGLSLIAFVAGVALAIVGLGLIIIGFTFYARARGYEGLEQFSWFHPYGLLTLLTMKDKTKKSQQENA